VRAFRPRRCFSFRTRRVFFDPRRRRPPVAVGGYACSTGLPVTASFTLLTAAVTVFHKPPRTPEGAVCCATGCICNLTSFSFVLAGALQAITILVGSARRLLREPHLCTPRLFTVGSTETTRELIHTYSKTDTLFAVQSKAYTEEEEC
jgi:hypothetical protein